MTHCLRLLSAVIAISVILLSPTLVYAKKGGNGGGNGGGGETEPCVDEPGAFIYIAPASGGVDESIMLSSSRGCTQLNLHSSPDGFWDTAYSRSDNTGTVVWTTDPGQDNSYVVEKLSISFDGDGKVSLPIEQVERSSPHPVVGEYYFYVDIASNGQIAVDHGSETSGSTVTEIIDSSGTLPLETTDAFYREYHVGGGPQWSSSGNDLYVQAGFEIEGIKWAGIVRYRCGSASRCAGVPPELIAAGLEGDDGAPVILSVNPANPNQIAVIHFVRKRKGTGYYVSILNTEACAVLDFPNNDWMSSPCLDKKEIIASRRASWHTANELLYEVNARRSQDIWLYTFDDEQSTKLIQGGNDPDSGN